MAVNEMWRAVDAGDSGWGIMAGRTHVIASGNGCRTALAKAARTEEGKVE